jgi:hypothetical protein
VLESYGAMGKGTQQLLKSMAHDGSAYSAIPHASFLANSVASISVGLQLGNALMVMYAMSVSRASRFLGASHIQQPYAR